MGFVKRVLYNFNPVTGHICLEWNNWVPLKVNMFCWKALAYRLPTFDELQKRGIVSGLGICSCCFSNNETIDHLFTSCLLASVIWQHIWAWCRIPLMQVASFTDVARAHDCVQGNVRKKKAVQAVIMVACWSIWKARNNFIFSDSPTKVIDVIGEIKILSFLWVTSRSSGIGVDWDSWKSFSL